MRSRRERICGVIAVGDDPEKISVWLVRRYALEDKDSLAGWFKTVTGSKYCGGASKKEAAEDDGELLAGGRKDERRQKKGGGSARGADCRPGPSVPVGEECRRGEKEPWDPLSLADDAFEADSVGEVRGRTRSEGVVNGGNQ